jgi:hypothetical protein
MYPTKDNHMTLLYLQLNRLYLCGHTIDISRSGRAPIIDDTNH